MIGLMRWFLDRWRDHEREARLFATAAHGATGQQMRWTGRPYIHHPEEVAAMLRFNLGRRCTIEMLQAAWLHDVAEDTPVGVDVITRNFGPRVGTMVYHLRKQRFRGVTCLTHMGAMDAATATVKAADTAVNTRTVAARAPEVFARRYLRAKAVEVDLLADLGADPGIVALARRNIASGEETLQVPPWRRSSFLI
jgi:(p)ppGpp synthase/HD superfamily hydrolase